MAKPTILLIILMSLSVAFLSSCASSSKNTYCQLVDDTEEPQQNDEEVEFE